MRHIFIIIPVFYGLINPCYSQGLDLRLKEGQLIIKNSAAFNLKYLPSEDFQKLDWQAGYAYYLDGSSRKFDGMKYDPELGLIRVSVEGHVLTLLPGVINGVSMETNESVTRIFIKVPLEKPVFMEALSTGEIHLLIYRKVKAEGLDFYQQSDATNFQLEEPEPEPVEYDEFIYTWSKQGVKKLKSSKKAILSMMKDHAAEVEAFIDTERIKRKEISDLMKLFDYYNSL
jgi:hypothetical protein